MMTRMVLVLLVLFLAGQGGPVYARDYEDALVQQLVRTHARSGIVWLGPEQPPRLGLYSEAGPDSTRAAIILHSMGMHADWPDLVEPLRNDLPVLGWATLSLQLPVLPPADGLAGYGDTLRDAGERLRAGVRYLQDRGYEDIVVIGYSFGATTAVRYLLDNSSVITALVGISMENHEFLKPRYDLVTGLSNLAIPVLDIYASEDFSGVRRSADDRRLAGGKRGTPIYRQLVINGTDHTFTGREADLARQISQWLDGILDNAADLP